MQRSDRVTALLFCCLVLLCGCQSSGHPFAAVMSAYDHGDMAAASAELDVLADQRHSEQDLIALDRAVLHLMNGQPDETVRVLETTRRRLEFLEQSDLREQTVAALKDDSAIAWSGREFEQRMVDNLQIVASLLQNDDDAFALASRGMDGTHADRRQLELQTEPDSKKLPEDDGLTEDDNPEENDDNPTETNGQPPATPPARHAANRMTAWLAAAIHSERIQDADATDELIQQVAAWEPSGDRRIDQFSTLGTRTERDSGTLQVIVFTDRISPWTSKRAMPTSAALLAADRILSATGKHTLPPTTSPVLIGRPKDSCYTPTYVTQVSVGDTTPQPCELLVDLNAAAWDSWQADRDKQLARAVVRRVVKKGTVYGTKNALHVSRGSVPDFLLNAAGAVWESRERADLRYWNLLPAAVEVTQFELPAGDHQVTLQVRSATAGTGKAIANQLQLPVTIDNGRNTFVVCYQSQGQLSGVQSNR